MSLGADCYVPAGYDACRCGDLFVTGSRPTGRCAECDTAVATAGEREVVVRIDGTDVVRKPNPRKRARRPKPGPAEREARRLYNRARSKAFSELARRHHDEYLALLEHHRGADAAQDSLGQ